MKAIKKFIPYRLKCLSSFLYKNYIQANSKDYRKFQSMINTGEIVLIPSGFRCWTRGQLLQNLDVTQASLPFDWGFFSPASIVNVIKDPKINLKYPDKESSTHAVCMKYENFSDPDFGLGIKFETSSYDEINYKVKSKGMSGINKYLDDTYGYYTLDVKKKFILAHYNWHPFSGKSYEQCNHGVCIDNINKTLNRRIRRMFELCNSAKYIFFVVRETQQYKYILVKEEYYDLHDFVELTRTVHSKFQAQCFIVKADDIDSPRKILSMI